MEPWFQKTVMGTIDPTQAVHLAIERAGSKSALGRICGVSHTAVKKWAAGKNRVAAENVLTIEQATGVSRHDLRPDIYPRDDEGAPASDDLEPSR